MPADSSRLAARKPEARSRVTNGRQLFLADVDGRSVAARRYRDVVQDISIDLGGNPSTAELILVKRAAALTVQAETMEAAIAQGESLDTEALLPVVNALCRVLNAIGLKRREASEPTLRELLGGEVA